MKKVKGGNVASQPDEQLISFLMSQGKSRAAAVQEVEHDANAVKQQKKKAEEESKPQPED